MSKRQNIVVKLAIISIFSKILGLFRDIVLADVYGTSAISDAFLIATSIPLLLYSFVGQSISTVFLPIYNKIKYAKNTSMALKFTNGTLLWGALVCFLILLLLQLFPSFFVGIFAPGFDHETLSLTIQFIRICSWALIFMTLVSVWSSYLNAEGGFIGSALISVPRNIVLVVSIVLSQYWGVATIGFGFLLAYFAECVLLIPFLKKRAYSLCVPVIQRSERNEMLHLLAPVALGFSVSQINKIIDRSLATRFVIGGVSSLTYASILNTAIQEVLIAGVITVLFANCASLIAQERHEEVKNRLSNTIEGAVFVLLPATVGILCLAEPIVRLVLCRGSFSEESLKMTAGALRFYTIGLVFLALRDIITKVFFAYKDTKTTTSLSILAIVSNIVLNFILSSYMGLNGLALATSLSSVLQCMLLYVYLRKKIGDFGTKRTIDTLLKSALSCLVMAVFLSLIIPWAQESVFALLACVACGALIYFIAAYLLNVDILKRVIRRQIA